MVATLDPEYASLIGVLVRGLQRDPRARYHTAEEFGRALSALLPDPITARDEVTRFFDQIMHLEKAPGGPQREAPSVGSAGSIVVPSMASPTNSSGRGWVHTAMAASMLTVALFAVVVVAMLAILAQHGGAETLVEGTAPTQLHDLAADEPAGPAGEGAPGEERPPPVRTGERAPPRASRTAPKVAPVPQKSEEGPVRVRVIRKTDRVVEAAPPVDIPAAPVSVALGTIIVGAKQPAEVYIGGRYVAPAPVTRELPPGRYAISLVASDGRRRTFEVDLESGGRISRTWDFDRMEWR
jgi:hypothetical protein